MTEGMPVVIEIILAVLVALGFRELAGMTWRHFLGKKKTDAEIDAIHLSNAGKQLADLREAMGLVGQMRKEMEADKRVIAELKDSKIEDDRKIARRDGVIEEQRKELKELHQEVAELRVEVANLKVQFDSMKAENKMLVVENAQLKGMLENAGKVDDLRQ